MFSENVCAEAGGGYETVKFICDNLFCPADVSGSTDVRSLGIALCDCKIM